jgi:hypothetical protein
VPGTGLLTARKSGQLTYFILFRLVIMTDRSFTKRNMTFLPLHGDWFPDARIPSLVTCSPLGV